MKSRMFLLASALLILSASQAAYAQQVVENPKPLLQGPDLITDGIREMDLNNGKIEIAVRNIGQRASVKSLVRILITIAGQTGSTGHSEDVRALAPGTFVWVPILLGKPLNLAKYCVIADALKQNQETNEKNNERCGEFSGKP